MTTATPAYDELSTTWSRLHRLGHLQSLAGWDQAANMPPKGNAARAAALSEMAALMHRLRTDPSLADSIARAEQEALSELQRANLREIQRDWRRANALPESLVQRRQLAGSRCEHAWRTQRPANDWRGFLGNFREVLAIAREEAELLSQRHGVSQPSSNRIQPGLGRGRRDTARAARPPAPHSATVPAGERPEHRRESRGRPGRAST